MAALSRLSAHFAAPTWSQVYEAYHSQESPFGRVAFASLVTLWQPSHLAALLRQAIYPSSLSSSSSASSTSSSSTSSVDSEIADELKLTLHNLDAMLREVIIAQLPCLRVEQQRFAELAAFRQQPEPHVAAVNVVVMSVPESNTEASVASREQQRDSNSDRPYKGLKLRFAGYDFSALEYPEEGSFVFHRA
jgi:hypothetical protein